MAFSSTPRLRIAPSSRSARLVLVVALAACTDVDFGTAGSGGAGGAAGPASSVGTGGVGGASCVPAEEQCNGLDDDCNGFADDPPGGVGEACGCRWSLAEGRTYAFCPATAGASTPCPGGMLPVVLESDAEFTRVTEQLAALDPLGNGGMRPRAFVGLRQSPGFYAVAAGWQWREGAVGSIPPWFGGAPTDGSPASPYPVENHRQDCAVFVAPKMAAAEFVDHDCDDASERMWIACESSTPECNVGVPCLGENGCHGLVSCGPNGPECIPQPEPEQCNDRDDDCDGEVDATAGTSVCRCGAPTPTAFGTYRVCALETTPDVAACGPGYRLAMPRSQAELDALAKIAPGLRAHLGGTQSASGIEPSEGWTFHDGAPIDSMLWTPGEPNDLNATQDCLDLWGNLLDDTACDTLFAYICQAVP